VFARSEAIARRLVVAVIGGTLLAIGVVLLVVPGPGLLTISIGLGVLALEFAWARRWLRRLKRQIRETLPFGSDAHRR
jgi:tellurite resistance protein TerC